MRWGPDSHWADDGETHPWSMDDHDAALGRQRMAFMRARYRRRTATASAHCSTKDSGVLLLPYRFPLDTDPDAGTEVHLEGQVVQLSHATEPTRRPAQDFRWNLTARFSIAPATEFLVFERGGWNSPQVPYALFALIQSPSPTVITVNTAPAPCGSISGSRTSCRGSRAAPSAHRRLKKRWRLRLCSSSRRSQNGCSSIGILP